jgi:hypothetical protein
MIAYNKNLIIFIHPGLMAQIRVKKGLEGVYKAKYAVLFSIIITFFLSNKYVKFSSSADYITNFKSFFTDSSLLVLYGSLIGLLLAAYAIVITLIPYFSSDSLQQPIFSQVNRLFIFTIMDGIMLMVIYFLNGVLPISSIPDFIYFEVFMFFALLIGLFFSVLTLSDIFNIIRKRGTR